MGALEQKRFYWVLLVPVLLFLGVFLVLPLVLLLLLSFRDVDAMMNTLDTYSFSQYVEVFSSDIYLKTIGITLWTALKTTVLCLVMAYPAAYLLVKAPTGRLRALFYILLVSPLLTSVVIRTFSWIVLLSQNGIVNEALISLKLIEKPLPLLWNMNAVIIAYVQVMLPFAVLPLAGSLSEMKPDLKFASMSLGAGRLRTFFFVTLPMTVPGLLTGAMIVFSLSAGSYITPLLVGGRMQPLLPLSIYQQVMQVFHLPLAAAMSITLLAVVSVVIGILGFFQKRWEARING
ncbi:Spermidine/putrescine transport system permease protein PotB [Bacillus paralicheniformis]|uniref:ABC transporter permease n=2 Tax=Bacillus paralicheniformis TaxID=1648923 RepID=A0A6I7TZ01_9BACI|nr:MULTISPECIES: ABC transporter permease [Bacillus]AJO16541.1 binding-protein dependent transport system inner membrane protein [Bacillus paralicheniformis]ARA84356.1 ABC transporter permease [Bacillus paralicheniformis]KAA0836672.1 ABC transporter permease [Bacillus paralicheniformis]KAA0839324.1 ABC transporter permease [Bacillus paralicheniformis]KFM90177.1 binding--dependent transport system inner membrane component family protein [Bacillus paralicheniformis]